MKTKNLYIIILLSSLTLLVAGCVKESSMDEIVALQNTKYNVGDTTYIEISEPMMGFNKPSALLIGKDNLLYIADTYNDRIVMMNVGGVILGERRILRPISITQDFRLDLLVGCSHVIQNNNRTDTIGIVIRIHLYAAEHRIETAVIDTVWRETAKPQRRIMGITALPDNTYLIARAGTDNSSVIDPDTRIMVFTAQDRYLTPISDFISAENGTGINYINKLTSISSFPNSKNFIVLQKRVGVAYCALWYEYKQTSEVEGWVPKFDPANPKDAAVDFIQFEKYGYKEPRGLAIDNRRGDIFITDAEQDTVMKFDSRGKFRRESFGNFHTNGKMKRPTGIAYFDKVLFVADEAANCIFRFKQSIDF